MAQAKGSNAQLLFYKEVTFGVPPTATGKSHKFPFNTIGVKASRNMIAPVTITGVRSAVMPAQGNTKVGGQIVIPLDVRNIGFWLQGLMGIPTTTQAGAKTITQGGVAVNVATNITGLPCPAHGFFPGEQITIANSTHYNGVQTVTTNPAYLSTTNQVNINVSYQSETIPASCTATPSRYTHIFKCDQSLYSYSMEVGFTDIAQFFLYPGCKFDKFAAKFGGDAELTAQVDVVAATESLSVTTMDASPISLGFQRYSNFQAAIKEAGATIAIVKELQVETNNNLDSTGYCIGGGGVLGSLPEGLANVAGSINAIFQDAALYNKAQLGTESSLEVICTHSNGVWSFDMLLEELNYQLASPGVPTPMGVWVNLPFMCYYDNNTDSNILKATLVNDVPTYVWT